jgi:hypothetical protein
MFLENKSFNLGLKIGVLFVIVGAIIFPSWWVMIVQSGGAEEIIYQAKTEYLLWNIALIIVIYLVVHSINKLEKNSPDSYENLKRIFSSTTVTFLYSGLAFIAIFRLWNASISSQNDDFKVITNSIKEKIQSIEDYRSKSLAIKSMIEPLYIDKLKVDDLYAQIAPKLTLTEKSIGKKEGESISAELGNESIAKIGGKVDRQGEQTEKYKTRVKTSSEKLVLTVNHLNEKDKLIKLKPITVDSVDLTNLNNALETLQKHQITFDQDKSKLVINEITNTSIRNKLEETYTVNSWILLSGDVAISSKDDSTIKVTFDYIPNRNDTVSFSCEIPSKDINATELNVLKTEKLWELNIVGKIIHKKVDGVAKYKVNCLSLYR